MSTSFTVLFDDTFVKKVPESTQRFCWETFGPSIHVGATWHEPPIQNSPMVLSNGRGPPAGQCHLTHHKNCPGTQELKASTGSPNTLDPNPVVPNPRQIRGGPQASTYRPQRIHNKRPGARHDRKHSEVLHLRHFRKMLTYSVKMPMNHANTSTSSYNLNPSPSRKVNKKWISFSESCWLNRW